MKTRDIVFVVIIVAVLLSVAYCFGVKKGSKPELPTKPLESFLVEVIEPNYIAIYGIDLESRLVYNIALLNQVVNRQGRAIDMLDRKVGGFETKDPNR